MWKNENSIWQIQKVFAELLNSLLQFSVRSLIHIHSLGMFLLMGIGYLVAVSVLISEIVGGCAKRCRQFARRNSRAAFSMGSNPNPSKRESCVSQSDETSQGTSQETSQEKFRRLVWQRFRRNSDQSTMLNEVQDQRKKHGRSGSVSVSINPATSFGVSQANERWAMTTKDESDIDEISSQNEMAECGGSAKKCNHVTIHAANDDQVHEIMPEDMSYLKGFAPSEEEFGDIVEHSDE